MSSLESTQIDDSTPISVGAQLHEVNTSLVDLLRGLSKRDWDLPTIHADRNVKDLAAHLLHGSIRRVSALRDHYHPPTPPAPTIDDLIAFIQRDNREFMAGMHRVSPQILIELIERFDQQLEHCFDSLEPNSPGLGVAWAGQSVSRNWFDIAREYTEKWHHQQQIRDATDRPPLYSASLLGPVLDTFARGFPFAYRELSSPDGMVITISTTGPVALGWSLRRERNAWTLWTPSSGARNTITISADLAWRLWTKGRTPDEARRQLQITGDPTIAEPLLGFVAIMA